jgi:hypothetical protein
VEFELPIPREVLYNASGKVRARALLWEVDWKPSEAIFTIRDTDKYITLEDGSKKFLKSIKKLFVDSCSNDPTEYEFAMTVFGSWDVWSVISNQNILKKHYLPKWRQEAVIRIKSKAIKSIHDEMVTGGRSAFSAAKFLVDKGWLDKEDVPSRKTKEQKAREEREDQEAFNLLNEDAKRMGLILSPSLTNSN